MNSKLIKLSRAAIKRLELFVLIAVLSLSVFGQNEEDENYISPTRPSVSESAKVQKKGVLQIEYGGDFDSDAPDFRNSQTAPLGVYFTPSERLRLDVEFGTVASQKDRAGSRATGIGDVSLGFKAIARDKPEEKLAVAFSYSIKLPSGNTEKKLSTGKVDHNLRAIFNRTYGKDDFIVNVSYLNVGREMSRRRDAGAQVILRYDRELSQKFGIISEFFGNTVNEELPRGLYMLGALTYQISKRLKFDAGIRPGFGRAAPRINLFAGVTVGVANLLSKRK